MSNINETIKKGGPRSLKRDTNVGHLGHTYCHKSYKYNDKAGKTKAIRTRILICHLL